jgi:hypothetical protein
MVQQILSVQDNGDQMTKNCPNSNCSTALFKKKAAHCTGKRLLRTYEIQQGKSE